jgi:hypothetical protein
MSLIMTNPKNEQASYGAWDVVVKDYSLRKPTFARDKLIAISGLARFGSSINKDKYIAAHWRKALETQLLVAQAVAEAL